MKTQEDWYDDCIALQRSGKLDEAIKSLHDLEEAFPDYPLTQAALAVFYAKKELFDEAIKHGKKYCELEPTDAFGFTALSSLSIKAGMRHEAEDALMKAQQARMNGY